MSSGNNGVLKINDDNKNWSLFKKVNFRAYAMIFALVVIAVAFQIMTQGTFLNSRNISVLIRQMSITAVITTGMTLLIISGNFDLAVGSVVGLAGGMAAVFQVWYGWSTASSIAVAILVGCAIGVWQGFWVAYRKVPSFIVTLGGMMIFRGIYLVISDGITITPLNKSFTVISQGFVNQTLGLSLAIAACIVYIIFSIKNRYSRKKYGFDILSPLLLAGKLLFVTALILGFVLIMNNYLGIPNPVLILVAIVLIFIFIARKTVYGRQVYAIGGNIEAARFSGINVEKVTFVLFIIMGLLSAVSGVLSTARLDGATASAGTAFEMDAIAACVIGGTSLTGGKGSIAGAMIGALIMASLDNGMSLMNTSSYYQFIVKGLVLIIAVWFDVSANKK